MKIKMKTLMAGPAGTRQPESVHDVSKKEADALISGGYAEAYVDRDLLAKAKEEAEAETVETAEAPPPPETAEQPKPKPRANLPAKVTRKGAKVGVKAKPKAKAKPAAKK